MKFKAMKFWIGKDEEYLYKIVCTILDSLGYSADKNIKPNVCSIACYQSGRYEAATSNKDEYWYNTLGDHQEIDLDWMRKPAKLETIELNGKQYLKSELEEALKHIKPIED